MMKYMTSIAAALLCGATFAEITSANIVGYTTVTAPNSRYVMVGGQFTSTLGEEGVNLQDFIKGDFTAVDYDDDGNWYASSPTVLLYNGVGYDWYYYQTDAQGTGDSADGWVTAGAEYAEDVVIMPGQGFWFIDLNTADGETTTITFAGQVPGDKDGAYTLELTGSTYSLIANPLPLNTPLNSASITWTGLTAVDYDDDGDWYATSPTVLLYNGVGYDWYYYQTDAQGTGDSADGWVTAGAEYAGEDVVLATGAGCWFRNPAGTTVSVKFTR